MFSAIGKMIIIFIIVLTGDLGDIFFWTLASFFSLTFLGIYPSCDNYIDVARSLALSLAAFLLLFALNLLRKLFGLRALFGLVNLIIDL